MLPWRPIMSYWHTFCVLPWMLVVTLYINTSTGTSGAEDTHDKWSIVYPVKIRGEYDLPLCTSAFSPCNILQQRFWKPMLVQRQCLCPARTTCPFDWSNGESDNMTVWLSNRSQMKFCAPINLDVCSDSDESAAELTTYWEMVSPKEYANIDSEDASKSLTVVHRETVVSCICPRLRYWRSTGERTSETDAKGVMVVTEKFACAALEFCYTNDFCGHIRADVYSTYYRCYCPLRHQCVFDEDRNTTTVEEFHFKGLAYRGKCLPDL